MLHRSPMRRAFPEELLSRHMEIPLRHRGEGSVGSVSGLTQCTCTS